MRRCPNCSEYTPHDSPICVHCLIEDSAWVENFSRSIRKPSRRKSPIHPEQLSLFGARPKEVCEHYSIRLSSFIDSGRLGFELRNIESFIEQHPELPLVVELNAIEWAYTWDYGADMQPDIDVYLPPSLPIFAIVETSRFVHLINQRFNNVQIGMVLPPRSHAVTQLVLKTALFNDCCQIQYSDDVFDPTEMPSSDDVLIPLTMVGSESSGQLSDAFFENFDGLVEIGRVHSDYRSPLRKVIMEAAENAETWGERGYISAYLRQESRGRQGYNLNPEINFQPERETHLLIHVYSIQGSLGATLNMDERNATYAVENGSSARPNANGLGMPYIIQTITEKTCGTIFINSGGFTRIISPDGVSKDFFSLGSDYLPGVHLGIIVPLAKISNSSVQLAAKSAA